MSCITINIYLHWRILVIEIISSILHVSVILLQTKFNMYIILYIYIYCMTIIVKYINNASEM